MAVVETEVDVSGGSTVPHFIETEDFFIANVCLKSSYCVTLTMM